MKKLLALVLALVMVLGCTAALAEKAGLGSVTSFGSSTASAVKADEKDGAVQINTTMAAVVLNDDGTIKSVSFDVAQNSVKWDAEGQLKTDIATADVRTKAEKKEDYGMKATSAGKAIINVNAEAGGEFYEQAAFFEAYCVGKTLDEVIAGVAMDDSHYPTAADVVVGITIHVNEFIDALAKAIENAK